MLMNQSAEERDFFQEFCLLKAPLSPMEWMVGWCFLCLVLLLFDMMVLFSLPQKIA